MDFLETTAAVVFVTDSFINTLFTSACLFLFSLFSEMDPSVGGVLGEIEAFEDEEEKMEDEVDEMELDRCSRNPGKVEVESEEVCVGRIGTEGLRCDLIPLLLLLTLSDRTDPGVLGRRGDLGGRGVASVLP
jgi:hypothetical protein